MAGDQDEARRRCPLSAPWGGAEAAPLLCGPPTRGCVLYPRTRMAWVLARAPQGTGRHPVTCSCPNGPVTLALPLFPPPVQMKKQALRGHEAGSGRSGSEPRPLLSRVYLGLWCPIWLAPGGGNVGSRRGCLMASLLGPRGCCFRGWGSPPGLGYTARPSHCPHWRQGSRRNLSEPRCADSQSLQASRGLHMHRPLEQGGPRPSLDFSSAAGATEKPGAVRSLSGACFWLVRLGAPCRRQCCPSEASTHLPRGRRSRKSVQSSQEWPSPTQTWGHSGDGGGWPRSPSKGGMGCSPGLPVTPDLLQLWDPEAPLALAASWRKRQREHPPTPYHNKLPAP